MKKFDLLTLILFILLIYALVAVLFTIKKSYFGKIVYTILISLVLFIISIFIYILYAFVPFFNTAEPSQMMNSNSRQLRLFIEQQYEVSPITTNQHEDAKVRKAFLLTSIIIFFVTIIFLVIKSKNHFLTGLLGSSAILMIPILWVFNTLYYF